MKKTKVDKDEEKVYKILYGNAIDLTTIEDVQKQIMRIINKYRKRVDELLFYVDGDKPEDLKEY